MNFSRDQNDESLKQEKVVSKALQISRKNICKNKFRNAENKYERIKKQQNESKDNESECYLKKQQIRMNNKVKIIKLERKEKEFLPQIRAMQTYQIRKEKQRHSNKLNSIRSTGNSVRNSEQLDKISQLKSLLSRFRFENNSRELIERVCGSASGSKLKYGLIAERSKKEILFPRTKTEVEEKSLPISPYNSISLSEQKKTKSVSKKMQDFKSKLFDNIAKSKRKLLESCNKSNRLEQSPSINQQII